MSEQMGIQSGIDVGYGYGRLLSIPFESAVQKAKESLKSEGFGVLCEIDIKEKLKEKLGVDFANYIILGACNPFGIWSAAEGDEYRVASALQCCCL